jgi:hypothetical protein
LAGWTQLRSVLPVRPDRPVISAGSISPCRVPGHVMIRVVFGRDGAKATPLALGGTRVVAGVVNLL